MNEQQNLEVIPPEQPVAIRDGRRRSKGTPERMAICRAAIAIRLEKTAQRMADRKNDPWFEHVMLFSKVSGNPDGCWNFTGHRDKLGYGKLKFRGKGFLAHRASFLIVNGHLPSDLLVCHQCDNPSCINPQHIFIGTNKDNTADSTNKGRRAFQKL